MCLQSRFLNDGISRTSLNLWLTSRAVTVPSHLLLWAGVVVILCAVMWSTENTELEIKNLDSNSGYIIYELCNCGVSPGL